MRRAFALFASALLSAASALAAPAPEDSIYLLELDLTTQLGRSAEIDLNRGSPTLLTMFYASCVHTCPLIVATLQSIERDLSVAERERLRVMMVSLDPERDSAQSLGALAQTHRIDALRWTLARTPSTDVRRLAAVLGVRYRALPDGEINHSTLIALLDSDGRIVATTSSVGQLDPQFMRRLREVLDAAP